MRSYDTLDTLKKKVRLATILGTIQSTYTHFPYLGGDWKKNTEEERLLGVSLTGVMDNAAMSGGMDSDWGLAHEFCGDAEKTLPEILTELKGEAIATNKEWAEFFGINQSTSITCNKPSGTVSQLVDSSSGIHARHSQYYIRTVRGDNKDPLTKFMIASGIPHEPEAKNPKDITVFSFPVAAPDGAILRSDMTALEQLELWLTYQKYWCEHNPSVSVTVREEEWLEVGAWVYKNFDDVAGLSFFPYDDHTYVQAPYQEVTEEGYSALLAKMPESIDWSELSTFEKKD